MDVFELRNNLISDYEKYVRGFFNIRDERIFERVNEEVRGGLLWPDPLIQLNPYFEQGEPIDTLVDNGILQEECSRVFLKDKPKSAQYDLGKPFRLHKHQSEAVKIAHDGYNYVLTTGTGSGKSLAYIIPIVDHVIRQGSGNGIQAIIVYPMNALANSQEGELQKFLCNGYPDGKGPVTFARYTGQESNERKEEIKSNPPDILLTNYVMLELILTRPDDRPLIDGTLKLQFLVLDELHTYRGRQGADVALLIRRTKNAFSAEKLQCVGTSATLAGSGSLIEQQIEVAAVASALFGARVEPEHIIGESIQRATPEPDLNNKKFIKKFRERLEGGHEVLPTDFPSIINDPLSSWIESTFGVTRENETGRLIRTNPLSISGEEGAAKKLSELTGVSEDRCREEIQKQLLISYQLENPETGFPVFAFRLHQFISRGDTVYASLEDEAKRFITLQGQQYVPGDRSRTLYPLVFCRECGQEYYSVRKGQDSETRQVLLIPRDLSDRGDDASGEAGYTYISSEAPWPTGIDEIHQRVPEDWLEEHKGQPRVKRSRKSHLPQALKIAPDGKQDEKGTENHFISAPFKFCLRCGVSYGSRARSDFAMVGSLGTEGRSTATTILSLTVTRYLKSDESLEKSARKLLSFTDNRQDAALQAGHFNDFIEIGLLRSALFRAAEKVGQDGLKHDELVRLVFEALSLPKELYASDPDVRFHAEEDTNRALRSVLGYRLYRDLKRGWRITAPNLEQCGLLEIKYLSLEDVCQADDLWENSHPVLASTTPETRLIISKTLLDLMRRELAIKVDVLNQTYQEAIKQQSDQRLIPPWAIDDNEAFETASVLFPRPSRPGDYGGNVYLSPRGGFGQYLGRALKSPDFPDTLKLDDKLLISRELLEILRVGGLVEIVTEPRDEDDVPGYQVPAAALLWVVGDGTKPFHDPIRVPRESETGGRINPFFVDLYRSIASEGIGLEAREHTAQVPYEQRLEREERFREAHLPILYCSPTMELGVDIADLNVVNMRNVPPTPANYAQRSGRAGRSGQPALVFTYCTTYSPHDQYFYKRPGLMVAGAVTPPRLDLANEDLIRSHVHAIWLAETKMSLGKSLGDVLDIGGEDPSLELLEAVSFDISAEGPKTRAHNRAKTVLASLQKELDDSDWYSENWLDEIFSQVPLAFNETCDRWRNLYRAALRQQVAQNRIIKDASRSQQEKRNAKRLRTEAEAQLALLAESQRVMESDFYSYRYFASEGFLPGYNFPRLPLSAYIPGRRERKGRNEFLNRPRFLAISEFGPQAIIYHEGSRYVINKVIFPPEDRGETSDIPTRSAKQCQKCGYLHPIFEGDGSDLCERCGAELGQPLHQLFRLQNVSARRRDKINSDEEERQRFGYEIKTAFRFPERHGSLSYKIAAVALDDKKLATLTYSNAATLWRINLGWARRAQPNQYGFLLDTERGYWGRNQRDPDQDGQDPDANPQRRVVPFVEDRRNCLLFEPAEDFGVEAMASLQAALKNAIQIEYQLEESELAAEALPSRDERNILLLYESAEGGAGVLRRLLDDPKAISSVAARALELCHFDPDTGEDLRRSPGAKEDCEAACYNCLMSYTNQPDHLLMDRHLIKDYLMDLKAATVESSPTAVPRAEHLRRLINQCQSNLEKSWLTFLEGPNLRLPSKAQKLIEECNTKPDFVYEENLTVIYVDGPYHDFPERQERDKAQTESLEDLGYIVIRFGHQDDWNEIISRHPNVFGRM